MSGLAHIVDLAHPRPYPLPLRGEGMQRLSFGSFMFQISRFTFPDNLKLLPTTLHVSRAPPSTSHFSPLSSSLAPRETSTLYPLLLTPHFLPLTGED